MDHQVRCMQLEFVAVDFTHVPGFCLEIDLSRDGGAILETRATQWLTLTGSGINPFFPLFWLLN